MKFKKFLNCRLYLIIVISLFFIDALINCESVLWAGDESSVSQQPLSNEAMSGEKSDLIAKAPEIELVFVKGGKFRMGDTFGDGEENEKPVSDVSVTDFYIGKYEVTQKEWKAVMGYNPSWFHECENCPVESVGWDDIQSFILELNRKTNEKYRLPTGAEWEFAARSGGKREKWSGANENVDDYVWYNVNANKSTHPVGELLPNKLGIYDMSGNVWEWVAGEVNNFAKPHHIKIIEEASYFVRGGSWVNSLKRTRCTYKKYSIASTRIYVYGFRLAKSP